MKLDVSELSANKGQETSEKKWCWVKEMRLCRLLSYSLTFIVRFIRNVNRFCCLLTNSRSCFDDNGISSIEGKWKKDRLTNIHHKRKCMKKASRAGLYSISNAEVTVTFSAEMLPYKEISESFFPRCLILLFFLSVCTALYVQEWNRYLL